MGETPSDVLFLGKKDDDHCSRALDVCRNGFGRVTAYLGDWGDPMPQGVVTWSGDYIISYLSRWILPSSVIEQADRAALNFHPGPPEYPGYGCNNFALYDEVVDYGVTCHRMAAAVDTGAVVAVRRFEVFPEDTVESLLYRAYDHQLELFREIIGGILEGAPLPSSSETWGRRPYTRREFRALGKLDVSMSAEEMARRVRATSFGQWQPTLEVNGLVFEYRPESCK